MSSEQDWKFVASCTCSKYYTNNNRTRKCPGCKRLVKYKETNPTLTCDKGDSKLSGKDKKMYIATREGMHLSMIYLPGNKVGILSNKYLKVGESIPHPPGYSVLLVVAPTLNLST